MGSGRRGGVDGGGKVAAAAGDGEEGGRTGAVSTRPPRARHVCRWRVSARPGPAGNQGGARLGDTAGPLHHCPPPVGVGDMGGVP
jgi:hypothetical protein